MYRSNELLVRNDTTVIGPHAISGIPAGAAVTCPYFDGKTIVLCIMQLPANSYELRSYAVTPTGFVQKSVPVGGSVCPFTWCDQSYVWLYEATAASSTFRLYSKSLKALGS